MIQVHAFNIPPFNHFSLHTGGEIAVEYANLLSRSSLPVSWVAVVCRVQNMLIITIACTCPSEQNLGPVFPLEPKASPRIPREGATRPPADLIVVGAAAVDVIAQAVSLSPSNNSLIIASTVPGTVQTSLGGVARNVAEAAHRAFLSLRSPHASHGSLLVSPLGDDSFGIMIRREMESMGMRSDGLLFSPTSEWQTTTDGAERRSPVCNMLISGTGDLIGGVADFTALDSLHSSEVGHGYRISLNFSHTYLDRSFRF